MFLSKTLNKLFYEINWDKPAKVADKIMKEFFRDYLDSSKLTAKELLKSLEKSEKFPLFVNEVNKLDCSLLYKGGLHGQDHIDRVSILAFALALNLNLSDEDIVICLECAKYHDIGRVSDGHDKEHGLRGARKYALVDTGFSKDDKNVIAVSIAAHSVYDNETMNIFEQWNGLRKEQYARSKFFLEILKDADALDRFRVNDTSLNPKFLRIPYSFELLRVGCEMFHAAH
ncbi:MAG: HD domain-containing protein [Clostridiales bacterium]|jgi:hypothetical protein|nr:HD domain-containing protein [Clostridiales bacterium]